MIPKLDHEYRIVEFNRYPNFEVFIWLVERFGRAKCGRWFYRHPRMYFQDPKDHLMFILKWANDENTKTDDATF